MFLSCFGFYDKIIPKDKEYFMRKLLILPIVVMSFFADFGAFAANVRGARGVSNNANNNAGGTPVAARAAVRGTAQAPKANTSVAAAPVSARAAVRNTPKTTNQVKTTVSGGVAARAGAKQKVINKGTKIATATTNTVVSQDCQDAFFGCMDSFCLLENVSGGRCKCSDKNAEYDDILAQIMELDQQSYVMQTEGVSLLKMGKSADEVYAMAESAAKKVTADKKDGVGVKKSNSSSSFIDSLFEDDEEEVVEDDIVLESDLITRTGSKLLAGAASVCTAKMPTQCKDSVSLVRMMYSNRIQSDCAAYENSLQQQQLESNQKLQAARQALRDTALEKYNEQNKYDLGGCVREYANCMQRDDACGEGYASCVTFAATDNMQNSKAGPKARQTPIEGMTGIKISASTMEQLLSKRVYCDSILEQCVNVKDQVWNAFLKSAVASIKTAESDSEDKLRRNCVAEISSCFQDACKEQMDPNNPEGSFDMCLRNPNLYKDLCKAKLEPCLIATGGTFNAPEKSSLWTALLARLDSMRVDACTKEVKDCLLSEDRCGKDYAGCIGLSTADIGELCPEEKLTACYNELKSAESVRDYVARVAQGIALNIDNSMLTHCQTALKTAMLTFCGDEDTCPNAAVDENMFKDIMSVQMCKMKDNGDVDDGVSSADKEGFGCSTDPYHFKNQDLIDGKISPLLIGKVDLSAIKYAFDAASSVKAGDTSGGEESSKWNQIVFKSVSEMEDPFDLIGSKEGTGGTENTDYKSPQPEPIYSKDQLERVRRTLNTNFKTIVNSIESDPKVMYCTSGRKVQGFNEDSWIGKNSDKNNARFPSLTQNVRAIIAQQLLVATSPVYFETQQQVAEEQLATVTKTLSNRINEIVQLKKTEQDRINSAACKSLEYIEGKPTGCTQRSNYNQNTAEYNSDTAVCTFHRQKWHRQLGLNCSDKWTKVQDWVTEYQMPILNRENLLGGNGGSIDNAVTGLDTIQSEVLGGKTKDDFH